MILNFDFYKAPKEKINAAIDHYEALKTHNKAQIIECEMTISKMRDILEARASMKRHRERLNTLADSFIKTHGNVITGDFIGQIQKEFQCNQNYAQNLADLIRRKIKTTDIKKRNARIIILSERMSLRQVGDEFGITKQAVHKIVKGAEKSAYF